MRTATGCVMPMRIPRSAEPATVEPVRGNSAACPQAATLTENRSIGPWHTGEIAPAQPRDSPGNRGNQFPGCRLFGPFLGPIVPDYTSAATSLADKSSGSGQRREQSLRLERSGSRRPLHSRASADPQPRHNRFTAAVATPIGHSIASRSRRSRNRFRRRRRVTGPGTCGKNS
jgi:hypothetical protein